MTEAERFEVLFQEWKTRMGALLQMRADIKTDDPEELAAAKAAYDAAYEAEGQTTKEALSDLFLPGWREDLVAAVAASYVLLWDEGCKTVYLVRSKNVLPAVPRVAPTASKEQRYDVENRAVLLAIFEDWLKEVVAQFSTRQVWVHFSRVDRVGSLSPTLKDQAVYRIRFRLASRLPLKRLRPLFLRQRPTLTFFVGGLSFPR
jgi:hypothetical protein